MINNIYFDLDECLVATSIDVDPGQECFKQRLLEWDRKEQRNILKDFYTIIRPCAKELFEFAQNIVGEESVYILTDSTFDYASGINNFAGFVDSSRLLTREDLDAHVAAGAYGGSYTLRHKTAHKYNLLIDNLTPRDNERKTGFLGIMDRKRYHEVRNYYGVNFPDDPFQKQVEDFILDHALEHENNLNM
jgi:hypothetical protein